MEIQLAVHEWYPTWPVAGRLATLATTTGVDLDATLLTPIVVAAETGLALATTSEEIAELVAYVASPLSSATNGAALRVEGGVIPTIG